MIKILLALKAPDPSIEALLEDHSVEILPEGGNAEKLLAENGYHLILIEDQIESVPILKDIDPRAEIILIGKQESEAIDAIKEGAAAYFSKPIKLDSLKEAVKKISDVVEMRRETGVLEKLLTEKYNYLGVVGKNPHILEIISLIRRIAPYYRTVLLFGATGTGKEVIAKALHRSSPWADQPFIVCNCGSLVEGLIESELFGHVKGSFTGAIKDKEGLFEAAGEGTLFLDEIGELPLPFQPHLLRVLQDGDFRRVGSPKARKARCRIIAATNKDLKLEVSEGRFRDDLYFRITPITIEVLPLRHRKDDLPLLGRVILDRFRKRTDKKVFGISRPAQAILMKYNWPGNVRELENVLERAAILTSEPFIRPIDLPAHLRESPGEPVLVPEPMTLHEVEKRHIEAVLQQYNGNRSKSSGVLGISRRALIRKIQKFSIY